MKNSILVLVIASLFLMDLQLQARGNNPRADSSCLIVEGSVGNLNNIKSDYTVELICANKVIKTVKVKDNRKFRFTLNRNTHYAVRISKKGYVTRLVSIHTQVPEDDRRLHRFYFDTDLISSKEAKYLDEDALDFPIAVVSYDEDISSFYYNEEYTAHIKKQLYTGQYF